QDLANVAWAYAKLGAGDGDLAALKPQLRRRLPEFEPQNLAITAWACATLAHVDVELFQAIAERAYHKAAHADPQCCANLLYSFGKLAVLDQKLVLILERLEATVDRFKTLELCNAAWGISKMSLKAEQTMQAIATAVVAKVQDMNPQDLSRTAWAFANARIKHEKLMDEISWESMAAPRPALDLTLAQQGLPALRRQFPH
ncbi:unnamed protein product, partial [Effrenium voratum]